MSEGGTQLDQKEGLKSKKRGAERRVIGEGEGWCLNL